MFDLNSIRSLEQAKKVYPNINVENNIKYPVSRFTKLRGCLENMELETTEADMAKLFANEKRKLTNVWLDCNGNIIRWLFKGESGTNPTPREMSDDEVSSLHRAIKKCKYFNKENQTCKVAYFDEVICPMLKKLYVGGRCSMLVEDKNNKPENKIRKAKIKCKFCGKLFEIYKHQVYCCEKCRIAGKREMNKLRTRRHRDSKI